MRILRAYVALCCLFPIGVQAQFQTHTPVRFASFYIQHTLQTEQHLTDSIGNFKQSAVSMGMVLPLVHKEWNKKQYSSLNIQLHPALNYTRLHTAGGERLLKNPQLAVSTFFTFFTSNRFVITVRSQLNEDEFTATYPQLLWNGIGYYSRNIGKHLQLHAGGGYSFIWGNAKWYPIAGADLSIGKYSRLTLLYPLLASYQITPSERIKLAAFAKPTGLMSFFENRLNIPDTNQQTLVFSLQSLTAGIEVSWLVFPSLTLSFSPTYSPQQTAKLQNNTRSQTYSNHNLSEAFVFNTRLVWRPWQSGKRNSDKQKYHFRNDLEIGIPF